MKEKILSDLPVLLEQLDDVAKKIYEPSQIWLESIQFADYVSQLAKHLLEGQSDEGVLNIATQLANMANSFKQMGENALNALDAVEKAERDYGSRQ